MKVLQINCVYPIGSTGNIVRLLHQYLQNKNEKSYVLFGIGDFNYDNKTIFKSQPEFIRKIQSLYSKVTGYEFGGAFWGTKKAINIIKKIEPDIVHLHCINGCMINIYEILFYLKNKNINTIITLHADFMFSGGCDYVYDCTKWKNGCNKCEFLKKGINSSSWFFNRRNKQWQLLKEAYDNFKTLSICSVSPWLTEKAKLSPFFYQKHIITVLNSINTNIFFNRRSDTLKAQLGLPNDKKLVLHVTSDFAAKVKGGVHVVEMANRFLYDEVVFIVIGKRDNKTIYPPNLIFVNHISDQDKMALYYSAADIVLITSIQETFSMVCAESQCCGTPIVAFKAGGPETISIPGYSAFAEQGNDDNLESLIRQWLFKSIDHQLLSQIAIEKFSPLNMCEKYYNIYKSNR